MPDAVICGYARTPFGKFRGALSAYSAVELGIMAVSELLTRTGIDAESGLIDQVYIGQVLQAGSGQAPARQVALGAGLPVTTPCTTINNCLLYTSDAADDMPVCRSRWSPYH